MDIWLWLFAGEIFGQCLTKIFVESNFFEVVYVHVNNFKNAGIKKEVIMKFLGFGGEISRHVDL